MGFFDFLKKNNKNAQQKNLQEYYDLPYFGNLNIKSLEDYYESSALFNGHEINLDLNFDETIADKSKMDILKYILENIEKFDDQNKSYIKADFGDENGESVKLYIEHHLEEVPEEELKLLIDRKIDSIDPENQLLNKLSLVRLGLYPDNENYITTFDYSIGKEITQYLIVITTDKNGELIYITMES